MENVTLEKVIKFKNQIDKIESVVVHDDLDYKISEDKMSAKGIIKLNGSVETLSGIETFDEQVDVDIYTPFTKLNDVGEFKLAIKDYNYMIQNCSLIIHIILEVQGMQTTEKQEEETVDHEIVNALNQINEIEELTPVRKEEMPIMENDETKSNENNAEVAPQPKEEKKAEVTIKENPAQEAVEPSWATNLFNLDSSYTTFKVIHVGENQNR